MSTNEQTAVEADLKFGETENFVYFGNMDGCVLVSSPADGYGEVEVSVLSGGELRRVRVEGPIADLIVALARLAAVGFGRPDAETEELALNEVMAAIHDAAIAEAEAEAEV